MILDADRARLRAHEVAATLGEWPEGVAGDPLLVSTLDGDPSYWFIPILQDGSPAGALRLWTDGELLSAAPDPARMGAPPPREEAVRRARELTGPDARVLEARYVHDGPPGREAWLVTVGGQSAPRRILVSGGGAEERRPS